MVCFYNYNVLNDLKLKYQNRENSDEKRVPSLEDKGIDTNGWNTKLGS